MPALPPVARLHLLARERADGGKLVRLTDGHAESGNWKIAEAVAQAAVVTGAELHLHERQSSPSWIAGRIDGWRRSADEPGRIVLRFTPDDRLRRAAPTGWGRGAEKRYVRLGDGAPDAVLD